MGDQKKETVPVDDAAAFDDLFLVLQKDITDLTTEETSDAFQWFKKVRKITFLWKITFNLNKFLFKSCIFLGLSDTSSEYFRLLR